MNLVAVYLALFFGAMNFYAAGIFIAHNENKEVWKILALGALNMMVVIIYIAAVSP